MSEYSRFDRQFFTPNHSKPKSPDLFIMILADDKEYSARFHHQGKVTLLPIDFKDRENDAAIGEKVMAYIQGA